MTIKRFQEFPHKNEDTILDECGYPEALPFYSVQPYYKTESEYVFLFVEECDINWKVKPDSFSHKLYQSSKYNPLLIPQIEKCKFPVFIKEKESKFYRFYGIFELLDPYVEVGGAGRLIDTETALTFHKCEDDFVI